MSKFTDTVQPNTPRLVVTYTNNNGVDQFQWGVVGGIPLLSLVGGIVKVQANLGYDGNDDCPECALVMAWNSHRKFDWFVHPDIPVDALVGMLETIKLTIVSSKMGQQAAAQQVQVLGPDGQPVRR